MRIALVGSHGTGKTTLATGLANALDLPMLTGYARAAAKSLSTTPQGVPLYERLYFQWNVLGRLINSEKSSPRGFVADRSAIDLMAYLALYAARYNMDTHEFRRYCDKALDQLKQYDLLVYLPVRFPLQADEGRWVHDQESIDRVIQGFFKLLELFPLFPLERLHVVQADTPEARVAEVLAVIQQKKEAMLGS